MSCNISITVVLLMLACAPLDGLAADQDPSQDPDQLWDIGWQLSQYRFNNIKIFRDRNNRLIPIREQVHIRTMSSQIDLSRELLTHNMVRLTVPPKAPLLQQ